MTALLLTLGAPALAQPLSGDQLGDRLPRAPRTLSGLGAAPQPLQPVPGRWVVAADLSPSGQAALARAERALPGAEARGTLRDAHSEIRLLAVDDASVDALDPALRRHLQPLYSAGGLPVVPSDRVLVDGPREGVSAALVAAQLGGQLLETYPEGAALLRVRGDALSAAQRLRASGLFATVHADLGQLYELRQDTGGPPGASDPYYPRQWHLENTGQDGALPGADVNAEAAWQLTRGRASVVIAIVDTGVDPGHEDLDPCKLLEGYNAVLDAPGAADTQGHGTACAGVAAARADNGVGVAGLCPNCRVLPIHIGLGAEAMLLGDIFSPEGSEIAFDSHIVRALYHAADSGAAVISNSWGPVIGVGPRPRSSAVDAALTYAATEGRDGLGAVVLFAAGNEAGPVVLDGVATHPQVMAIAATNDQDIIAAYSNVGPEISVSAPSNGLPWIDGAKTTGIWTTDISGDGGYNAAVGLRERLGDAAGHYIARFGGTSSATPLVAGLAGLVLSLDHSLSASEVREIIEASAVQIDPVGGDWDGELSPVYGHGRIDAGAALALAMAGREVPALGDACAAGCGGDWSLCVADPLRGAFCTRVCASEVDCGGGACEGGVCQPVDPPCEGVVELCGDGADNDGDGEVDEGCEDMCGAVDAAGTCEGGVLRYCDAGRVAEIDCGARGGSCQPDADGLGNAACSFDCPEEPAASNHTCAGPWLIECRYTNFFEAARLRGVSVRRCADACIDEGGYAYCGCGGALSQGAVCEGEVRVSCEDGQPTELPCADGCSDGICECDGVASCEGQSLSFCNALGANLSVQCPEACGMGEGGFFADCGCDPEVPSSGLCEGKDAVNCVSGETVRFECPEGCEVTSGAGGTLGLVTGAQCTCSDVPIEGACQGSTAVQCAFGYRTERECPGACGFVFDASDTEVIRAGCLCEGMEAWAVCDGGDVLTCLSDGEIGRVACADIEPGTDTCVSVPDADPHNLEEVPVRCVASGAPVPDGAPAPEEVPDAEGGGPDAGPEPAAEIAPEVDVSAGSGADETGRAGEDGGCSGAHTRPTSWLLAVAILLAGARRRRVWPPTLPAGTQS